MAHLIGKAGEHRVISELMLRGHCPSIPEVDNGVDIILENGLHLQVKTSHLGRTENPHRSYKLGYYRFNLLETGYKAKYQNVTRDWTLHCDYLVLWGIDEDRFWILPATKDRGMIIVPAKAEDRAAVIDIAAAKDMYARGMNMFAISKALGVSRPTVKDHLTGARKGTRADTMTRKILQYENRWDLLDMNSTVETLIESAPATVREEKL